MILIVCNLLYISHVLPLLYWIFGIVEVAGFFYFTNMLSVRWQRTDPKTFIKLLFLNALFLRITWVVFSYYFYNNMTGQPFEFSAADSKGYHLEALWLSKLIHNGNIKEYFRYIRGNYSDMGYPFYLGWQYWLTGGSILIARIIKAILGALICILIYKFSKRCFSENVGRNAAIFCMLMPNLIYYTGMHLKETEMVFLTVWFVERADYVFRNRDRNFFSVLLTLALATSLFFFRTVLGITAVFSFISVILFSPSRFMTFNRRLIMVLWISLAAAFLAGGQIESQIEETWSQSDTNQQKSLEFRASRKGGNTFYKDVSKTIFLPTILIIPLPTVVNVSTQENQMILNGGNFIKDFLIFFVIMAFYSIIKKRNWRHLLLILFFTTGYLIIISLSAFAQSERFHQPVLPFLLVFAAYGLSETSVKQSKYINWYALLIFLIMVGWSWFKLAGRGLL